MGKIKMVFGRTENFICNFAMFGTFFIFLGLVISVIGKVILLTVAVAMAGSGDKAEFLKTALIFIFWLNQFVWFAVALICAVIVSAMLSDENRLLETFREFRF